MCTQSVKWQQTQCVNMEKVSSIRNKMCAFEAFKSLNCVSHQMPFRIASREITTASAIVLIQRISLCLKSNLKWERRLVHFKEPRFSMNWQIKGRLKFQFYDFELSTKNYNMDFDILSFWYILLFPLKIHAYLRQVLNWWQHIFMGQVERVHVWSQREAGLSSRDNYHSPSMLENGRGKGIRDSLILWVCGKMSIYYALIARGTVVLVDHTNASGNFEQTTASILPRIAPHENTKCTYVSEG